MMSGPKQGLGTDLLANTHNDRGSLASERTHSGVPGEGFLKEGTFAGEKGRFWRKGLQRRGRESWVKWPQKSHQSAGPAISG